MITVHIGASSHHHPDTPHVIKPQQPARHSQPNPSRSWNGRGVAGNGGAFKSGSEEDRRNNNATVLLDRGPR